MKAKFSKAKLLQQLATWAEDRTEEQLDAITRPDPIETPEQVRVFVRKLIGKLNSAQILRVAQKWMKLSAAAVELARERQAKSTPTPVEMVGTGANRWN